MRRRFVAGCDRDLLAPDVAGEMAQRERLAMRGVALKPGLESFADDAPVYLVERLPVLDGRGATGRRLPGRDGILAGGREERR